MSKTLVINLIKKTPNIRRLFEQNTGHKLNKEDNKLQETL